MWMELDEGFFWATGKDNKKINYKPKEINFKSPSEHKLNGQEFDVEMQIPMYTVSDDATNSKATTAVVSIFFDNGIAFWYSDLIDSLNIPGGASSVSPS